MNTNTDDIDPFIKMPVIHYQFESIHPFYDGNGRTGRILNVLYLVMTGKLDFPVLFLSEYINKTRQEYYRLFNATRSGADYTGFIVYLLEGIIIQARDTTEKIIRIRKLMKQTEETIAQLNLDYHKITMILFSKPFLTVSDFAEALGLTRQSATKYISLLEDKSILSSIKVGKNKLIYIQSFINILI
jgi:Fic family protein